MNDRDAIRVCVKHRFSASAERVFDIARLPDGCEVTITHDIDPKYADFAQRTHEGWARMLELAALVAAEPPKTCGAGLAQQAVLPAKIAKLFAALAEVLERHRGTLVQSDPHACGEDEAYGELAASYREIARLVERAAARMLSYRELPTPAHDESAFGPQQQAFEALVRAQDELLATLRFAAESDHEMLAEMTP
jgi:hypothetical protein